MTSESPTDPAAQCLVRFVEDAMADAVIVLYTRTGADHQTEAFAASWGNQYAIRELVRMEHTRNMSEEIARMTRSKKRDAP